MAVATLDVVLRGRDMTGRMFADAQKNVSKFNGTSNLQPIQADMKGFKEHAAGAATRMRELHRNIVAGAAAMTGISTALLPLAGGFLTGAVLREGEEFNANMQESLAIMNATENQQKVMRQTAFEVGRTTKNSSAEAAKSFFFLASAGLDAAQSIEAMPTVATFAQAGMFDMAEATALLTDAQNSLGKSFKDPIKNQKEMHTLANQLVKANTLADATVRQFAIGLSGKMGGAMKSFNVETSKGIALLAAFAQQGVKGEEAQTAASIVLRDFGLKSTDEKFSKEFDRLGVDVFENNQMDPIKVFEQIEAAFSGMTIEEQINSLKKMGFTLKTIVRTMQLLGESSSMKEFDAAIIASGGTLEDVANKQLTDFGKGWEYLKGIVVEVGAIFMDTFGPAVAVLMRGLAQTIYGVSTALQHTFQAARFALGVLIAGVGQLIRGLEWILTLGQGGGQDSFGGIMEQSGKALQEAAAQGFKEVRDGVKLTDEQTKKAAESQDQLAAAVAKSAGKQEGYMQKVESAAAKAFTQEQLLMDEFNTLMANTGQGRLMTGQDRAVLRDIAGRMMPKLNDEIRQARENFMLATKQVTKQQLEIDKITKGKNPVLANQLANMVKQRDKINAATEAHTKQLKQQAEIEKKRDDQRKRAVSLLEGFRSPVEKLKDQFAELHELKDAGAFSDSELTQVLKGIGQQFVKKTQYQEAFEGLRKIQIAAKNGALTVTQALAAGRSFVEQFQRKQTDITNTLGAISRDDALSSILSISRNDSSAQKKMPQNIEKLLETFNKSFGKFKSMDKNIKKIADMEVVG